MSVLTEKLTELRDEILALRSASQRLPQALERETEERRAVPEKETPPNAPRREIETEESTLLEKQARRNPADQRRRAESQVLRRGSARLVLKDHLPAIMEIIGGGKKK